MIINSRNPAGSDAKQVKEQLKQEFGIDALISDCQALDTDGIAQLLRELLYSFPMTERASFTVFFASS